jgi:ferritin-like metal-binding protein YciE
MPSIRHAICVILFECAGPSGHFVNKAGYPPLETRMSLDTLHGLFVDELKDLYSAENQLLKALPRMAKGATHPDLKAAFTEHLEVTRGQVVRLEKIFQGLDSSPKGKKCKAMEGLIEEGKELLEQKKDAEPSVLDAALIGAAQRVEHYEMAGYGCVRTFAKLLGNAVAQKLLQETLDEEAEADERLTSLAEAVVNPDALGAGGKETTSGNGRVAGKKKAVGR